MDTDKMLQEVQAISTYSKVKSGKLGQVFTPTKIIQKMIDALPKDSFSDPNKTFLDPCAGNGNFTIILVKKLMFGLKNNFPDEEDRYRHIIEKQIFLVEIERENCDIINRIFNPFGKIKLNIMCGDMLKYDCGIYFEVPWPFRGHYFPEVSYYENANSIVIGLPEMIEADKAELRKKIIRKKK